MLGLWVTILISDEPDLGAMVDKFETSWTMGDDLCRRWTCVTRLIHIGPLRDELEARWTYG